MAFTRVYPYPPIFITIAVGVSLELNSWMHWQTKAKYITKGKPYFITRLKFIHKVLSCSVVLLLLSNDPGQRQVRHGVFFFEKREIHMMCFHEINEQTILIFLLI